MHSTIYRVERGCLGTNNIVAERFLINYFKRNKGEQTSNEVSSIKQIIMTSLDKYDKIYAKYSAAIDPPSYVDPPARKDVPRKYAVPHKEVGLEPPPFKADSPERDAMPVEIKFPSTTQQRSTNDSIKARYLIDQPEPKLAVASRDDDDNDGVRSLKQPVEERSRDDMATISTQMQSSLNKFNAERISMRSIYGSPSASISASSKVSAVSDPPSHDIESTLKYLTEQSLDRKATVFPSKSKTNQGDGASSKISARSDPPSIDIESRLKYWTEQSSSRRASKSKSEDRSAKAKKEQKTRSASSVPMKALSMKLISEQAPDGFRITHDKCSDCQNYKVGKVSDDIEVRRCMFCSINKEEAYNDIGDVKCAFCPINDFRAMIQVAVSNRVMAAKRIQGDKIFVSDGKCEHCHSSTQEGISCEVCPVLDYICIEVAKEIGRGGVLSYSCCNDCGSRQVRSSDGDVQHCIVCNVLNEKLGEQQLYKPHKAVAEDAPPLEKYEATLQETAQQLEKLQQHDALQIQLDEELTKAKNAQSLLGITMANIAYESKTRGIRTELKEEFLKAKAAQLALQKVLESSQPLIKPDTPVGQDEKTAEDIDFPLEQDEDTAEDTDFSGLSYEISQREIDKGNVKEYIPPPKHFFARGIPKTIRVKDQSYPRHNLKQSTLDQEQQYSTYCCGKRIQKQPSGDRADNVDNDSINTDDQCTVDMSLNSYESKLAAGRHGGRKLPVKQTYRGKETPKGRSRRCFSILNLCGCAPSFDSTQDARLDESMHSHDYDYDIDYRPRRLSFDNEEAFDKEEEYHRLLQLRTKTRRDDDSSYDASMYSNITPHGILKSPRYSGRRSNASVQSDDQSRLSSRGHNSVSSGSESRRVSFYNYQHHRDLDIDKLKTLTEEGDESFESQGFAEVRRKIAEAKAVLSENRYN